MNFYISIFVGGFAVGGVIGVILANVAIKRGFTLRKLLPRSTSPNERTKLGEYYVDINRPQRLILEHYPEHTHLHAFLLAYGLHSNRLLEVYFLSKHQNGVGCPDELSYVYVIPCTNYNKALEHNTTFVYIFKVKKEHVID